MKRWLACVMAAILVATVGMSPSAASENGASVETTRPAEQTWSVWGGTASFGWNKELLPDIGMELASPVEMQGKQRGQMADFALRDTARLGFKVAGFEFKGFTGGSLALRGGFDILAGGESLGLAHLTFQPRPGEPFAMDLVSNDGKRWLYVDRLLYEFDSAGPTLEIRSMDIRISKALADKLGNPDLTGIVIGSVTMSTYVHGADFASRPKGGGSCPSSSKWPGTQVPGQPAGTRYQADVFMQSITPQYMRKQGDGRNNGTTITVDDVIMYTPSSTLRNSRSNGSATVTVPGVPASSALWAADVPWHTFFTSDCAPYENDQHPFLIWNMYRVHVVPGSSPVQFSRIEQIGRSGVKHAYLTTNGSCDLPPANSHVLALGCMDTYGTGDNDSDLRQGPRDEIVPALGLWGRCGSDHDPNCDGSTSDRLSYGNFENRMVVRESQVDPNVNPNVQYWFESWYIVRDDIDIYNTMQTTRVTPSFNAGAWPIQNTGPTSQGSAIDRFVARGTSTATARSTDINRAEGEGRVTVKVTDLGGGQFRYDYAVMNFDFAEAVIITDGSAGPDNVSLPGNPGQPKVVSNDGFTEFRVPLPAGAVVATNEFADGDTVAGNDWSTTVGSDAITWTGVAGNQLNWGTLFRFSFVANVGPQAGAARLRTARADTPTFEVVSTLVPEGAPVATYSVGGAVEGVNGSDGVDLRLNGSEVITRSSDAAYAFSTELNDGATYTVDIVREPTGRDCTISNASATIAAADVLNVDVSCAPSAMYSVGGNVSGLDVGQSVTLQLNGAETKIISASGAFEFDTLFADGTAYVVQVIATSPSVECSLTNGSDEIEGADVTNIVVGCETLPPDVFDDGFESVIARTR
jgi:hypothetical protein